MSSAGPVLEFVPITQLHLPAHAVRLLRHGRHIDALAASIAAAGLLQPLLVRTERERPAHYLVVAGANRLEAARRLYESDDPALRERVSVLPCLVREANEADAFANGLVENLVRHDLTRREMMDALVTLKDTFGWSVREVARRLGRSDHDVSELLRVAADPEVALLVAEEKISPTAAGLLVQAPNYEVRGSVIADIRRGAVRSVEQVETALARARVHQRASRVPPPLREDRGPSGLAYEVDESGRVLESAQDASPGKHASRLRCPIVPDAHLRAMLRGCSEEAATLVESVVRYGAQHGWSCAELLRAVENVRGDG